MKKVFIFAFAVLALSSAMSLTSCGASDKEVVEKCENLQKEADKARREGDLQKFVELQKEAAEYAAKHQEQIQRYVMELEKNK